MTSVPSLRHPLYPELPDGVPLPPPRREPDERLGVPAWAPFAAALAALVGMTLVQFLLVAVVAAAGGNVDALSSSDDFAIVVTAVFDLLLVACSVAIVWRLTGQPTPARFGLRPAPVLRSLGWIVGTYIAVSIVSALVTLAFGRPQDQDLVTELKGESAPLVLVGFALMTCVLAPLAEEFFFRGFLFRALAERFGLGPGVVLAGAIFGLVHWPGGSLEGVVVLGALGAMLCLMVYYTASLLPCIIMHASFNSLAFGASKELPWWGYLLVLVGSVAATLAIALLAMRLGRRTAASGLVRA
jgi:membrane protease YdiL (CAAX protease family)